MDGSRRSAHGNAYFTGLGRAKRIVFFDTLVERLQPAEIEAVLAHELGHFKLKHIAKRLVFSFLASLVFLALLGWLAEQPWFLYRAGRHAGARRWQPGRRAGALHAGAARVHVRLCPAGQLSLAAPRVRADAYAARHAKAKDLVNALVKLYEDNASTLTPDPIHSAFYDSHPPASHRVERLVAGSAA